MRGRIRVFPTLMCSHYPLAQHNILTLCDIDKQRTNTVELLGSEKWKFLCYAHNTLRADYGSCSTYSMVSPLHPGHPIMGIPPVYSPRNLAAPIATSMMASLTSLSSLQTGQRERYSSGGGPNGASRASGRIGSWRLRRILPSADGLEFIIDDAIFRVPYLPYPHLGLAVRTAQGVSPRALLIPLAVGQGGDDRDRPFDEAFHFRHGFLHHALQLGKRLRRLHAVIADPWEAFGANMLDHAANKRVDLHRFPLHPLARVGAGMRGDPVPIVAINAPERERRTHHILREIPRHTLIP